MPANGRCSPARRPSLRLSAYVDARFSLLASSAALAERDPSYQPVFERLRRGLEADRYGLVAHVLMTRGCNGADCAELRLLRDPARVVANMKVRAFETSLGAHALAWQSNGSSPAVASAAAARAAATVSDWRIGAGRVRRPWTDHANRFGRCRVGQVRFPFGQFDSGGQHHELRSQARRRQRNPGPARRPPKRAAAPARRQGAREAGSRHRLRRHLRQPRRPRLRSRRRLRRSRRPPRARTDPHSTALSGQAEMPKGTTGPIRC